MEISIIPVTDDIPQDKFIIYRPLLALAFVGNQAMADLALDTARANPSLPPGSNPAGDFLRAIGFLEPDPPEPVLPSAKYTPTMAVLLLTNQCQLRCRYCYASAGESSPRQLTIDTARLVIDHVHRIALAQGKPNFEISFHGGGEPTLAWEVIRQASEYARQQSLPAKITLTSNGIWSKSQTEWILENIDGLTLSMDGGPEIQNRLRPFASGRGSASHVLRTVAALDRASFSYGIRMTAVAPWSDLPESVRYLCENTHCQVIQVEPTFNLFRGGHGKASRKEILAFGDAFLDAWDVAAQAGRRFYYSGARIGVRTATFCNAPFQALITDVEDNLVTCYEVTAPSHPLYGLSTIGRIDHHDRQIQVDEARRDHILGLIAARRETCRDCFCYWTCAGDCYARAFNKNPRGHLVHGPRCILNRYLTRRLLLNLIAQNNGVWHGFQQYTTPLPGTSPDDPGPPYAR